MASEEHVAVPTVTIESVDQALFDFLDRTVDAHVQSPNGERRKVPVVFSSGERWVSSRDRRGIRDKNGVLILPIISVRRTSIEPMQNMSSFGVETPYVTVAKRLSPKTAIFQNANDARTLGTKRRDPVVYEITKIPYPDFSVLMYEVMIQTQYILQMNAIHEKLFHQLDIQKSFVMPMENDHRQPPAGEPFEDRKQGKGGYFVGFFDSSIGDRSNFEEFTDQERIVQYSIGLKIPTYLQLDPEGTRPSIQVVRSSADMRFFDEDYVFVDDPLEIEKIFGR